MPVYQRPYEWTTDQWEEFFEDINSLQNEEIHFLGSIVVVPQEEKKEGLDILYIVDGQQRLTTIFIILCVIRDIAKQKEIKGFPEHIENSLLQAQAWIRGRSLKVKKVKSGEHDDFYLKLIFDKRTKSSSDNSKILDCYQYFYEKLSSEPTDLNEFYYKLTDKTVIVYINAFNHLNAFKLFETLNDRGLELSALDLIKNYILMKVSSDKDSFQLIIEEWNSMIDKIRDKLIN